MMAYIVRRLGMAAFVIWGVATICFLLTHIDSLNSPLNRMKESWPLNQPGLRRVIRDNLGKDLATDFQMGMGDPARLMMGQRGDANNLAEIRKKLGLDQPLWYQYKVFLLGDPPPLPGAKVNPSAPRRKLGLIWFDLGDSFKTRKRCTEAILEKLPNTAKLAFAAILVAILFGVTAGIAAAIWQDTWIDQVAIGASILGLSAPIYLVGLVLILVVVEKFRLIGGVGMDKSLESLLQLRFLGFLFEINLQTSLILPALALGVRPAANLARMTRSSMLEVIRQDYIRTARAKGLSETRVIMVHALKNALIPVITILGLELAGLLTGAVLTESVFAWPGLGRLTVQALRDLDLPLIQATVIFISFFFVISNLIVDLTYAFLDPRIRLK